MRMRINHKGFTLVEVVVVMPMMILTIMIIGSLLITLYTKLGEESGKIELELAAQSALFSSRDDLFYAVRFAGTPQPDTTDSYAPAGGWNAVRDNALVIYEAAYTKNRQSPDRELVYKKDLPHACDSTNLSENQYSTNTIIYFLKEGTVYRRSLIPDQTANCSTTYRKQSCPASNSTDTCPADNIIAENVKSFSLAYYRRDGDQGQIPNSDLEADPNLFIQVSRADIELTLEKFINGKPIQSSAKINVKKIE